MWSTVFNIHITNTLVCNNIFILVICVWRLFLIIVVWPERQRQSRHFLAWQSSWSTRSTGTQIPLKKNLGSNKKNANFDSTLSGFLKLIGVIFKCLHWASTLLYPRLSVDRRLRQWSIQRANGQYRDHLVGQLTIMQGASGCRARFSTGPLPS